MSKDGLKNQLINALEPYYTINEPYSVKGRDFEFHANFNQRNAKYFVSKELEFYSFSIFEHLFFKRVPEVTESFLNDLVSLMKESVDEFTKPDKEHMETCITYVIQSDEPLSNEMIKNIKKIKHVKNYLFGLKGWSKIKIIVMVPSSNEVYVNKFGIRDKKNFQNILEKFLKN